MTGDEEDIRADPAPRQAPTTTVTRVSGSIGKSPIPRIPLESLSPQFHEFLRSNTLESSDIIDEGRHVGPGAPMAAARFYTDVLVDPLVRGLTYDGLLFTSAVNGRRLLELMRVDERRSYGFLGRCGGALAVAFTVVLICCVPVAALMACAGAATLALRSHSGVADAARITVIAGLVFLACNVSLKFLLLAVFVGDHVAFKMPVPVSTKLIPAALSLLSVLASAIIAAQVTAQPWQLAATHAAATHAASLPALAWLSIAVPRDAHGRAHTRSVASAVGIVDVVAGVAFVFAPIVGLVAAVPAYRHNLAGTGSLMGLFGAGPIAFIAASFPDP